MKKEMKTKKKQKIKKLFNQELILGNARASGFGKCEVVSCELVKELPYQEYLPCEDQENGCYMMLLSNTVLRSKMVNFVVLLMRWWMTLEKNWV